MSENSMNMVEVGIRKFCDLVEAEIISGNYDPYIGIGKSGIGKTESIFERTQKMGIACRELRLVTLTETDMLGIPYKNEYNRTQYASNDELPHADRDGEVGILVLDEFTSASKSLRAATFQLLDSKRALGNYKLPPKWKVIALGNGPDDGGVFTGTENAFLSRCMCFRVQAYFKDWREWAIKNGVNPVVTAFLSAQPDMLHKFEGDDPADPNVFPCPRSWVALSKRLDILAKHSGGRVDEEDAFIYAGGCVGSRVASKFHAFYKYHANIINPQDILEGRGLKDLKTINNESLHITIQGLAQSVREMFKGTPPDIGLNPPDDIVEKTINMARWLAAVGDRSLDMAAGAIDSVTSASGSVPAVMLSDKFNCPEFDRYADKMGSVLRPN